MIYNFRFDRSNLREILRRIENDRQLSQGWGGGRAVNLDLRQEDFVAKTVAYHDLRRTNIASNLTRMRQFRNGDMVVVPHLPEYGTVSIHVVDGDFPSCYSYDASDDTCLNHRITLKNSFGLGSEISIYNEKLLTWYGKLKSLQLPVLPTPEFSEIFSDVVTGMRGEESPRFGPSQLDDFLNRVTNEVKGVVTKQLLDMPSSGGAISFESLCERLLKANGYQIEACNQYDRQGGDVDLRCKRSRRDTSIFEGGDVTLFVQVKKHDGNTDKRAVEQVLRMIKEEPQADGCVMSMADGFTDEAKEFAENNGIVLLDRHEICGLLMPLLSQRMAER